MTASQHRVHQLLAEAARLQQEADCLLAAARMHANEEPTESGAFYARPREDDDGLDDPRYWRRVEPNQWP